MQCYLKMKVLQLLYEFIEKRVLGKEKRMSNKKEARIGVASIERKGVSTLAIVGMIYAIVCAGAFGVEELIMEAGPGLALTLLIVMPFIWAIPYSIICAEMGKARPVEGGTIAWVKEGMNEFWYAIMNVSNVLWSLVCNTVYVVLAVNYIGTMIQLTEGQATMLKFLMIFVFLTVNLLGLKEVGGVSVILSVTIFVAFAFVAIVGFVNWNSSPFVPFIADGLSFGEALSAGFAVAVWMYSSFEEVSVVAGEVEGAERKIPKALMIGIPVIALTYILPTLAGLGSVGRWAEWSTDGGVSYHTVLTDFVSPVFGVIFMVVAVLGQLAIFNVCITTGSRSLMMAADSHFVPKSLAKISKKNVPYVSIVFIGVATACLMFFEFHFLVVVDVFFMAICTILTIIASSKILKTIPREDRIFKKMSSPGMLRYCYFAIGTVCVLTTILNGLDWFLGGLIWMMLVPPIYVVLKWVYKGLTLDDAIKYPLNPKTKLGYGNINLIGKLYVGLGIYAILARYFIQFYELSWGPAYYRDENEGFFSSFWGMLETSTILGIASIVLGLILIVVFRKIDREPVKV